MALGHELCTPRCSFLNPPQREKFASEASAMHAKHLEALEEMKLRELENVDLLGTRAARMC